MKYVEITREEFDRYLPCLSIDAYMLADSLFARTRTIKILASIIDYMEQKING